MQYATVIYKNSLTGISHWKAAHIKHNFIHNYDLVDISSWKNLPLSEIFLRSARWKSCQAARFRHHMITSVACFPLCVKDQRVFFSLQAILQCTFYRISLQSGSQKQVLSQGMISIPTFMSGLWSSGACLDLTVNFHHEHFIDPTNCPWVSEDGLWLNFWYLLKTGRVFLIFKNIWLRSRCKIFAKRRVANKLTN